MPEECLNCGFYDSDMGCTCPSIDKWYACPLEPEPTAEEFTVPNNDMKESYAAGYAKALKDINTEMLVIQEDWSPSKCPRCHESFDEFETCNDGYYKRAQSLDRCPYCGQKLSWNISKNTGKPKYRHMTEEEVKGIKKGDVFVAKYSNTQYLKETAANDAFWNSDADEPCWEVLSEGGTFYSWDSIYTK